MPAADIPRGGGKGVQPLGAVAARPVFLDSNIVLYLLSSDAAKAGIAEELLRHRPLVSVQVLNEVTHVCVRKLRMPWERIDGFLELVKQLCQVVGLTVEGHDLARRLAQRYKLSFYDANIAASATLAGCSVLYTEDMHHGLEMDGGLSLRNPFNAA